TAVVEDDKDGLHATAPDGHEAIHVVIQRKISQQYERASARRGRSSKAQRDDSVDPVRAAIGKEADGTLCGAQEGLEVAYRHARAHVHGTAGWNERAKIAVDTRLEQLLAE